MAAPAWANKDLRQQTLGVLDPPDDGQPATPAPTWAKPVQQQAAPAWAKPAEAPAKPKVSASKVVKAGLEGAYAPFKPIVEAIPKGVDAAIKGGANLVSGVAAAPGREALSFLPKAISDEGLNKLQKEGLYTPRESPVKEFSQAAYSGLMSPLAPAVEAGGKVAKAAGVPQWAQPIAAGAMDVLGVIGTTPGKAKAPEGVKPAPGPQLHPHEAMLKDPAHEAAKQQVLSRYAKDPVEHGVFMEGNTPKFSTVNGQARRIEIKPSDVAEAQNGVFHHNHPDPGGPLSWVDTAALKMPGVGKVVAHDKNGSSVVSLTPAGKQWVSSLRDKIFNSAMSLAWGDVKSAGQRMFREYSQQGGKFDKDTITYTITNAFQKALQTAGLTDYHTSHKYEALPGLDEKIQEMADAEVKMHLKTQGFSNVVPNLSARNLGPAQAMDRLPQKAAGGGGSQPPSPPANQGGQGASAPNGGVGDLPSRASDELFKLSNRDEARRTEYVQNLKKIQGVPNETWEKLYAQKDNPALPKAPEEQTLYDSTIKQISDRSEVLIKELKNKGIDFGDTGAAPRRVKGMSPVVEKIYGEKPGARGAGRKTISTFSPALQGRTMWALPGKVGTRQIVYVGDDGKLFSNGEPIGEILDKDTRPASGTETSLGKLEQATTAEIEAQTKLQYHKNLLANEYLRVQSLERAKDSADFLDWLKTQPEFQDFAAIGKAGVRDIPPDWRSIPDVRAFDKWKFNPRMAEVIEDYMGNIKSPEEYNNAALNIAKAAKMSIFMNPIMHMINATNMFATSKGLGGTVRDLPSTPRALGRAIKSVLTQDKEYREMAKSGLSLPSMRNTAQQFNEQLTRAMGLAIRKEPRGMAQLAKDWGYNSTAGLMKAWMKGSSKILWAYSDILAMTRVNEYMARGLSRAKAIKRTEQVMANYRVPTRVMGSRTASKLLQNPIATMFGRYDYNRFANLTGIMKRAISKDPQAWEARDQLLALAVMTTLGYTALDKWLQQESKNKGAHQELGGYSQLIDVGKQLVEGRKSPAQAALSAFAPGFLSTPIEVFTGQNIYTGRPIAQRGDWNSFVQKPNIRDAARMGFDVGRYAADKFMPIADIDRLATSDMTAAQFWLSQMGTQIPPANQQAGRVKAQRYARQQAKSAAKKRPAWVKDIE